VARQRTGIGRGLGAILSVSGQEALAPAELRRLAPDSICPNPRQPRRRFEEESLSSLAESMRERGVLQPLLVRALDDGRYELIAGERRWRAARIAGLETVPAIVRQDGDAETLELALIENMVREDLNPIEEARACAALVEELGLTREELGRRIGRSRVAVSNLMRLLDLPDEVAEMLEEGALSEGHGRALLLAEDHLARRELARRAVADGWSVRETERRARESNPNAAPRGPRIRARTQPHPDQIEAAREVAEALSSALGAEVRARPSRGGGYSVELSFASADDAIALARRLGTLPIAD
jgi:ParB family transcriptional regulator, chromosome partitioning protein